MRALVIEAFGTPPEVATVPDPTPPPDGVVVEVGASGVCRSDWHAWMGHDAGVRLPHVPGHEFAGRVVAVGGEVRRFRVGDLVTVPFVAGSRVHDVPAAVRELTGGGADLSLDAVGHPVTCANSIRGLRARGRHVQVGLLPAEHAESAVPMDRVVAHELEILGSHGMQAHRYGAMLAMVGAGRLHPEALVGRTIDLGEASAVLTGMDRSAGGGVTVITSF